MPTSGSPVIFDVGRHLPTGANYYTTGSACQCNFYAKVTVANNLTAAQLAKTGPGLEIVVLFLGDAVLVNELGASSVFTSLISKAEALKVADQPPLAVVSKNPAMIGGGGNWFSRALKAKKGKGRENEDIFGSGRAAGRAAGVPAASKILGRIKY